MDGPQTYRRYNMPVQQIELEEVQMVETCDAALEVSGVQARYTNNVQQWYGLIC
jgi:hypothetical protein